MLGDAAEDVTAVFMHSIVYSKAQKNNLIDFIPDAEGHINIPVFLGRRVIVDDGMPNPAGDTQQRQHGRTSGIYHTWLVGPASFRLGVGTPIVPTEVFRYPSRGNGAGSDVLFNRVEWTIHPVGHAWVGSSPAYEGGPTNSPAFGQRLVRPRVPGAQANQARAPYHGGEHRDPRLVPCRW